MKNLTIILFFALFTIYACKKESNNQTTPPPVTVEKGISYPDSIYYGKNILSFPDSTVLIEYTDYEMGAVLEKDASLSLVITNYPVIDTATGHVTDWGYSNPTGLVVTDYDTLNNTQKFISTQTGKIDLMISFLAYGHTGKCKIDFYENGNAITKTKHFTWH